MKTSSPPSQTGPALSQIGPALTLAILLATLPSANCQQEPPTLSGVVTRVTSPTDFDVLATHVLLTPKTTVWTRLSDHEMATGHALDLRLGDILEVSGKHNKKAHTITAERIVFDPQTTTRISGHAVIDAVYPPSPTGQLLRADGYLLLLPPTLKPSLKSPLTPKEPLAPNLWIEFSGTLRPTGTVLLERAAIAQNEVDERESRLIDHYNYDPTAVPADSGQSDLHKALLGTDPRKIPPYLSPDMQDRINRIGKALIPTYQRELLKDDPSRRDFRFQLVDLPQLHDALALPSGIILVPHHVVERLQNDSQVATLLADNIACVLEKQTFFANPNRTLTNVSRAIEIISIPAAPVTSSLALASTFIPGSPFLTPQERQSGRVSLALLHDAGYDLAEAPKTWWILYAPEKADYQTTKPPARSINLYQALGTTWRNPSTTPATNPPANGTPVGAPQSTAKPPAEPAK